ncbi:unnamed protein product [Heligmosomoides polygyrus]|uniref:Reverse transcriptase n=1 Tax=Heligmosomoides polygyrus TaxID=6339 RepID=A0A183F9U1_HELPZ|nr:unnamed protein product [Heligmosomoides polygyrus]
MVQVVSALLQWWKCLSRLAEYWSIVRRAQKVEVGKDMFQDGYLLLNGRRGGATSSVLDFRRLFSKLIAVYKIFGRVLDDDTPYDFDVVQDVIAPGPEQVYLWLSYFCVSAPIKAVLCAKISRVVFAAVYAFYCTSGRV